MVNPRIKVPDYASDMSIPKRWDVQKLDIMMYQYKRSLKRYMNKKKKLSQKAGTSLERVPRVPRTSLKFGIGCPSPQYLTHTKVKVELGP